MATKLIISLALVLCFISQNKAVDTDLPVVHNFDVGKYMGHWYMVSSIASVVDFFCICTQTTYTIDPTNSSKVNFDEFCRVKFTWAPIVHSHSYAEVDPVEKAKWINVNQIVGDLDARADYYIVDVDPAYNWALVGSRSRVNLYVLGRAKVMGDDLHKKILQKAASLGFDITKVELTNQSCNEESFLSN